MYYRLLCRQNGNYMHTGYNAKSDQELCDDYMSYKETDWDDEMIDLWSRMSLESRMEEIRQDEFYIERSETPSPPLEWED